MSGTITVKGVGRVKSSPDYVVVSMDIISKNKSYEAAVDGANRRIELLEKSLCSAGYEKGSLKTLDFTVNTVYDNIEENGQYKRVFAGYSCAYDLKLSFDFSAEALAKTLNAIVNSGADAEFSISFTVKEPEKISEKLLASATENAREKAEILCKASGKELGELVSVVYNWGEVNIVSDSNYRLMRAVPMASVPEFTPDDIDSSDTVTFVWEMD